MFVRPPGESDVEDLAVAGLDGVALPFHSGSIVFHGLDLLEWLAPRLLLRLRMHRAQPAGIDDQLLRIAAEAERLEQLCGVRIGRALEDTVGADDQRRTFTGIDRFDRAARLLHLENVVFIAIGHNRALPELKLFRRG